MILSIFKRFWFVILMGTMTVAALSLFLMWRDATQKGGQKPAEPFRIAGNLYYVGANDATSFLITSPEGHILIDGGYPGNARLIRESVAKLGFDIKDVRILLNTHSHFDHAGGLAELQRDSGAELWVSERESGAMKAGGSGGRFLGPFSFVSYLPFVRFTAPRIGQEFGDGAKIRLGENELTAHITPGHTEGCTSWSFPVVDKGRTLNVTLICSISPPPALELGDYPEIRADMEKSFSILRSIQTDIFLTPHARHFGRWEKYQESLKAEDPVEPFIDPEGYKDYLDRWEERYRKLVDGR